MNIDFIEQNETPYNNHELMSRLLSVRESLRQFLKSVNSRPKMNHRTLKVALVGRPNAGKSSLFNALLQQDRSLVSPEAGTTRDYVDQTVLVSGVSVELYDTAGLRHSTSLVENLGIQKTHEILSQADLVWEVKDSSLTPEPGADFLPDPQQEVWQVWNKVDLGGVVIREGSTRSFQVSAKTKTGISSLWAELEKFVEEKKLQWPEFVSLNLSQIALIESAVEKISEGIKGLELDLSPEFIAGPIWEARLNLSSCMGKGAKQGDIADAIFSEFCIGK